jgi:hypothetical protein
MTERLAYSGAARDDLCDLSGLPYFRDFIF